MCACVHASEVYEATQHHHHQAALSLSPILWDQVQALSGDEIDSDEEDIDADIDEGV